MLCEFWLCADENIFISLNIFSSHEIFFSHPGASSCNPDLQ